MAPRGKSLVAVLAIAGGLRLAPAAQAAPISIDDALISDPSLSPSLGRGYAIATNTFQNTCLDPLASTSPTKRFSYSFPDPDNDRSQAGTATRPTRIDLELDAIRAALRAPDGTNGHRHLMMVSIDLAADEVIDEGQSRLSPQRLPPLAPNDIATFVDVCGPYYTHSIKRHATYLTVLSYGTPTSARDTEFERQLKEEISNHVKSILPDAVLIPEAPPASAGSAPTPAGGGTATQATHQGPSVAEQVQSRKTAFRSFAFGLAKQVPADLTENLIAYDLKTLENAMTVAAKHMQTPSIGVVTAIDVLPWSDNAQFQAAFPLASGGQMDNPDAPPPPATAPKIPVAAEPQKRLMSQNAEFLARLDLAARSRLLAMYRARQCKLDVETSFGKSRARDEATTLGDDGNRDIVNRRTGATSDVIKLSKLYAEELAQAKIQALIADYEDLTFKKSQNCIEALLASGFTITSHRNIPACAAIDKDLSLTSRRLVADYCPVRFAPAPPARPAPPAPSPDR